MKKAALTAVVAMICLLLLVPGYAGKKAQQALDQMVAQLNLSKPGAARWHSYQQGWFGTQAVLILDLSVLAGVSGTAGGSLSVPLQMRMRHGPFIFDRGIAVAWFKGHWFIEEKHEGWTEGSIRVGGASPFLSAVFRMNLAGTVSSQLKAHPFALVTEHGLISITGYHGEATYKPLRRVRYSTHFDALSVHSRNTHFRLDNVTIDIASSLAQQQHRFPAPAYIKIALQQGSLTSNGHIISSLRKVSVESALEVDTQDSDLATFRFDGALEEAALYGDRLEAVAVQLDLSRLSLVFVGGALEVLKGVNADGGELRPLHGIALMSLVTNELLPPGPDLTVQQLRFSAPEGNLLASGFLRANEGAIKAGADPFAVLRHLHGELNVLVDKPLAVRVANWQVASATQARRFESGKPIGNAEQNSETEADAAALIQRLVQEGMLQERSGQYAVKATLEGGAIAVNGKSLPFAL